MAIYYVDIGAADDNGDGSIATPFKTLQHAESHLAVSGDTVRVRASATPYAEGGSTPWRLTHAADWIVGTWTGTDAGTWAASTSPAATVTMGAQTQFLDPRSGATAVTFSGFTFSCVTSQTWFILTSNSHVGTLTFTDCAFTTTDTGGTIFCRDNDTQSNFIFTRCTISQGTGGIWSALIVSSGNAEEKKVGAYTFTDCTITMTGSATDIISTLAGTALGPLTLTRTTLNILGATNNTIGLRSIAHNVTMTDTTINTTGAITGSVFKTLDASSTGTITLTRVTINTTAATSEPIINVTTAGAHTVILRGVVVNLTQTNQAASAHVISILNQPSPEVSHCVITIPAQTNAFDAIKVYANTNITACTAILRSNTVTTLQTGKCHGVCLGDDASDTSEGSGNNVYAGSIVEYNKVVAPIANSDYHSILVGYQNGAWVRYNHTIGGGYGVVIKGSGDWAYAGSVDHNICVDADIANLYAKGCQNVSFTHNTLVMRTGFGSNFKMDTDLISNATGIIFKYNICCEQSGIKAIDGTADQTFAACDNNCYWSGSATTAVNITYGGTDYADADLATWLGAVAFDDHTIVANPNFVSRLAGDYRLRTRSVCVNPAAVSGASTAKLTRTTKMLYKPQFAYGALPPIHIPAWQRPQ